LSRISVVIASLLKPVDDTRMYEKLGLSLAQTNKYEINIIGFSIKKNNFQTNVNLLPVFNLKRLGFSRFIQPFKYLRILFKVKPKIIIVNTHDFLLVTIFYSIITKVTFIYDLQENYLRNIVYNSGIIFPLNYILAYWVRFKEYMSHPFIRHYLVAENGYLEEMPFIRKKGVLLRNLYADIFKESPPHARTKNKIRILYSGTIAKSYGIFDIVRFISGFHAVFPEIELKIVGYCPHGPTLIKLAEMISDRPFIQLYGGNERVSHQKIIEEIRAADFGIIHYELNPAIKNCFPTRIYEYMANRLPILIQNYPPWSDYCVKNQAALVVDFNNPDFNELIQAMKRNRFYSDGAPPNIYWKIEEPKLLDLFKKIEERNYPN
jgi:glycosyltransferase involved in cell wall biosynthesis